MNVIIVGGGKIGRNLAMFLTAEGRHASTMVEKQEQVAPSLMRLLPDIRVIEAHAAEGTCMSAATMTATTERQVVAFRLGNETYAIDISYIHEIIRMKEITFVPRAPRYMRGVINLRGRIVPVMSLSARLGLPVQEETPQSRIIVVEVNGESIGMIVDAVSEVLRLPEDHIEPPTQMAGTESADYISGLGKVNDKLVLLLDVEKVVEQQ
jgi:purine-binding chemotaxis protein CheW